MVVVFEKFAPILPARDIGKAEAFYARLGFHTVYRDGDYLILKRDDAEAHFFRHSGLDPSANDSGAYLRTSDIDALSREFGGLGLPSKGIPRFEPAADKPWGMRELALIDPDGNLIRAGEMI